MLTVNRWVLLAAGLLTAACPAASAADKDADPELAWTKRVVAEFFDAALTESGELVGDPKSFLSPALVADLKDKESKDEAWKHPVVRLAWQYRGGQFRVKAAELSPAKAEVVVTGELIPSASPKKPAGSMTDEEKLAEAFGPAVLGPRRDTPADVTLWMAKDGGGRWVVHFIRATVRNGSGK